MPFKKNVFINCPFDDIYKPLLNSLIFTLLYLGYNPLISQTRSSNNIRINEIKTHIRNSKFSIHDLSRCKAMKKGELPRFNMPFELGLDIGCCEFSTGKNKNKKSFILETERHHYQKVLSDIAGQDIENHDDDPKILMKKVRDWFSSIDTQHISGANAIWIAYSQFLNDLKDELTSRQYTLKDIKEMPIVDFIKFAKKWINQFKS